MGRLHPWNRGGRRCGFSLDKGCQIDVARRDTGICHAEDQKKKNGQANADALFPLFAIHSAIIMVNEGSGNSYQMNIRKSFSALIPSDRHSRIGASCAGTTLSEVMLAMLILASALIPIFGLLTKDVKDTDLLAANSFAIDRSRFVLNTLLDNLPFSCLVPGNPAMITGPNAASFAAMLFPGSVMTAGGYACNGTTSDGRGIHYSIYLRSDIIEDQTTDTQFGTELTFSFYPNPRPEEQAGWASMAAAAAATEALGQPSIYRKTGPSNPFNVVSPYRYYNIPGAINVWGPATSPVVIDQRRLAQPDALGRYYLMQRLVLQIRWNLAHSEYRRPESNTGRPQRLHVVTYKANLD